MTVLPITGTSPDLEVVFGTQTAAVDAHIRSVLIEIGQQVEATARRVTGQATGFWGEFGLRQASSGRPSIEGCFSVAVAHEGELACTVELFPGSATGAGSVAKWEIFVNIDVRVAPPIGDGLPRPQYGKHFSASSVEQVLSKFTDAVKDLDERMMGPPTDWIARGKIAGT